MLCDDLEKWDRLGREIRNGGDMCVYRWLSHTLVQQKLTDIVKQPHPS